VMGAADIRAQIAGNVITDNVCLTAAPSTTANIYSTFLNEVANIERCQVNSLEEDPFCETDMPDLLDQDIKALLGA